MVLTSLEGRIYKTKIEVLKAWNSYKLFNTVTNGRINRSTYRNKADFRDRSVVLQYAKGEVLID